MNVISFSRRAFALAVLTLLFCRTHSLAAPVATAAEKIKTLPGFKIELLRSAAAAEGSWVAMTVDNRGRLIISPQDRQPLLRVTLSDSGQIDKIETIDLPVGSAMGLLYAFDSLYLSGRGPDGLALYRLKDTDGDDRYDKIELLRKFDGAGGEHGSHGLVLGPDKMIYYIQGNFVRLPRDISPESPHQHYAEDQLLPRQEDGNGFGVGLKPPGGSILRMDPDAKTVELFAAGMRNTYDFDFSPEGEILCFDSDMEWDWGMPWYRPIRILHLVSGGDYGFREGTGKWPAYYPDSLPSVVDTGIGSPTGVKFGTKSNYPLKYKKAVYAMDWSYGRLLAVHLTPKGASYTGTFENFVQGKPLNVTDLDFGKDGAMYFLTGGRGTQSGLYRVSYTGPSEAAAMPSMKDRQIETAAADARAARHELEKFHGRKDPAAIEKAWPFLDNEDRFLRYAARIAIESQPVEQWQERALAETRPNASITALLALARLGSPSMEPELLQALGKLDPAQLSEEQMLAGLRVLSLAFIRMGPPENEAAQRVIERLDPAYPAQTEPLNRELSQLLIYLKAPDVVLKTLALVERAKTQEEQLHYLFHLRTLKTGWTLEQRRKYFSWLNQNWDNRPHTSQEIKWFVDAGRDYSNGASFPRFMANIRNDAIAALDEPERIALAPLLVVRDLGPRGPRREHSFVKEWKVDDFVPLLDEVGHGRSFQRGREAFLAGQCIACHRFGNEGGAVGPELTSVSSRFSRRDILDSILEPSKVVSEQYQNLNVVTKDGDVLTGRLVEDDADRMALITNPLTQDRAEVRKNNVERIEPSKLSPMPEGLVNNLTKEEILDLLAYVESGGKQAAPMFQSKR